jgi:integrase
MNLHDAIESYLQIKRSLGAVFAADERILRFLERTVGSIPLEELHTEACFAFCRGSGPPTRWWERKHQALHGFFAYLVSRGHMSVSPLPEQAPKIPRLFEPYIYSRDELRRLLDATDILATPRFPMAPVTYRTLLLLLYGAGLRAGEGLRLRCPDVDAKDRVLSIWDTKFFKSRLVPIGPELVRSLEEYRIIRQGLPMPAGSRSTFFAGRTGKPISLCRLESIFGRLREHAGIRRPGVPRWQPRLHDLRATFAVNRLVAWYREGADVQACLPLLSTYLGHINISSTQVYLRMTVELLGEASKRFEHYASIATHMEEHIDA